MCVMMERPTCLCVCCESNDTECGTRYLFQGHVYGNPRVHRVISDFVKARLHERTGFQCLNNAVNARNPKELILLWELESAGSSRNRSCLAYKANGVAELFVKQIESPADKEDEVRRCRS